jgi:hypothetical protein
MLELMNLIKIDMEFYCYNNNNNNNNNVCSTLSV